MDPLASSLVDQIVNISNPTLKDWVIILAALGFVITRVSVWVSSRIDKRRDKEDEQKRQDEQDRKKDNEKFENYLSVELTRCREEIRDLNEKLTAAVSDKLELIGRFNVVEQTSRETSARLTKYQREELEIGKTITSLRERITELESLLTQNNIVFNRVNYGSQR